MEILQYTIICGCVYLLLKILFVVWLAGLVLRLAYMPMDFLNLLSYLSRIFMSYWLTA